MIAVVITTIIVSSRTFPNPLRPGKLRKFLIYFSVSHLKAKCADRIQSMGDFLVLPRLILAHRSIFIPPVRKNNNESSQGVIQNKRVLGVKERHYFKFLPTILRFALLHFLFLATPSYSPISGQPSVRGANQNGARPRPSLLHSISPVLICSRHR